MPGMRIITTTIPVLQGMKDPWVAGTIQTAILALPVQECALPFRDRSAQASKEQDLPVPTEPLRQVHGRVR